MTAAGDERRSGPGADPGPDLRSLHRAAALTVAEREALEAQAAAYAVDALEDAETAAYERHLERCALCRALVRDHRAAAGHLADLAGAAAARPVLKARLMAALHEDATPPVVSAPHARVPARLAALLPAWRRRRPAAASPAPAAAARPAPPWLRQPWPTTATALVASLALAVAGLGLWSITLQRQLSARVARAAVYEAVLTAGARGRFVRIVALAPAGAAATPGYAALVVPAAGGGETPRLIATGLPTLPAERAYQVWFIQNGVPRDAGIFPGADEALVVIAARGDVSSAQAVVLTIEPAGGSAAPTTPPILAGQM